MKIKKLQKNIVYPLVSPPQPQKVTRKPWQLIVIECIAVLLVYIVLAIAVNSVEQAQWMNPQPQLTAVLILAVVVSFILAKIRIHGVISTLIAVILGIAITIWQTSLLLPAADMASAVNQLITTLQSSIQMLSLGNPIEGTIHFAVFLMLVVWFSGFFSVWYLLKNRNCWIAVGLGILIILVNLSNLTEQYYLSFFFFLLTSGLLLAITNLLKYPHYLENFDIGRLGGRLIATILIAFSFSLLMISAVWLMPEINGLQLTSTIAKSVPFRNDMNEFFSNFLAKVPSKQPIKSSGLSNVLSLTAPVDLSDTEHFLVNSKKPFYWRMHVYDSYVSTGWTNSPTIPIASIQNEGNGNPAENSAKYSKYSYTVTNKIKTDILLTTGKITSIDIPYAFQVLEPLSYNVNLLSAFRDSSLPGDIVSVARSLRLARTVEKPFGLDSIQLRLPADLTLKSIGEARYEPTEENLQLATKERSLTTIQLARTVPDTKDIVSVTSASLQGVDQQYLVVSAIYSPSAGELTRAGENYPHTVTDYYLQLPSVFPERIRQLAKSVTGESKTPYEKVLAIKQYLSQIPYTREATESIPDGMDAVDYFLNNKKTGNCFYFASAEVVMLRSIGIPARIVVGYLPGEWDSNSGTSIIRAKNYHSWVEVYFPGHGWIEFEVTPDATNISGVSFVEGITALEEEMLIDENLEVAADNSDTAASSGLDFRFGLAAILIMLIAAGLAAFVWIKRYLKLDYASQIYKRMTLLASVARLAPKPQQTPSEYCRQLIQVVPDGTDAINAVGQYYMESRYGRTKDIDSSKRNILDQKWTDLRKILFKKIFFPG